MCPVHAPRQSVPGRGVPLLVDDILVDSAIPLKLQGKVEVIEVHFYNVFDIFHLVDQDQDGEDLASTSAV